MFCVPFNKILTTLFIIFTSGLAIASSTVYSETIDTIGGEPLKLSQYKGKTLLIVNIATRCGYTGQLDGLETLYKKHKDKGFVVLGIPSNDFGGQTPENEKKVKEFCKLNYGVTFPLTKKAVVKGENTHPLVKNLVAQSPDKGDIAWNFEKFLVNKEGQVVQRFKSAVTPEDKELNGKIEALLNSFKD